MVERVGTKAEMACHFLDRGGWDLFTVVFADAHCIGHQCWHLHDPGHPRHDPSFFRKFGDPMEAVYRALDKAIGRLLQVAGPEATVIFFAGSGMGPNCTGNHLLEEILGRLDGIPPSPARRGVNTLRGWYNRVVPDVIRSRLIPLTNVITDASRREIGPAAVTSTSPTTTSAAPSDSTWSVANGMGGSIPVPSATPSARS